MLLYEVNLKVKKHIEETFAPWLKEHIKEMLEIEGFLEAHLYTEQLGRDKGSEDQDKEGEFLLWTVHYKLDSEETLERYFQERASQMRKEGIDRFGENFSASRRVLLLDTGARTSQKEAP